MKRVLVLLGAGASVEYKAPSTMGLTTTIESAVASDPFMRQSGADVALVEIKRALGNYLSGQINFEQIYHVAHELRFAFTPTPGAADEFKPVMVPFLQDKSGLKQEALTALCQKMVEVIYSDVSRSCEINPIPLAPLSRFLEYLRSRYVTRIYTTNYDDFILQAAPDFYTGFDAMHGVARTFNVRGYWQRDRWDMLAYLHGSVHLGFLRPPHGEIGDLGWFDDRSEAKKYSSFNGSSPSRMDGTSVLLTPVITGLEKLSRVQQRPYAHYYSMMARDAMHADVIFVIGSGLADLHLNTWLGEARMRSPKPALLFVDYWPGGFEDEAYNPVETPTAKAIQLFHKLEVHISASQKANRECNWLISQDRTAAVWDKGFQAFLNAPADLDGVLDVLIGAKPNRAELLARRVYRAAKRLTS